MPAVTTITNNTVLEVQVPGLQGSQGDAGANATPGGVAGQVQVNDGTGGFEGDPGLIYTAVSAMLTTGQLKLTALPTSNPNEAGRLWNDLGTVKVSAG